MFDIILTTAILSINYLLLNGIRVTSDGRLFSAILTLIDAIAVILVWQKIGHLPMWPVAVIYLTGRIIAIGILGYPIRLRF